MILFFGDPKLKLFAVEISEKLSIESIKKLSWVLDSSIIESKEIKEKFIGPKSSMITPWSTNAVEITRNMGVENINRIEVFVSSEISEEFDRMIHEEYKSLDQNIFENNLEPEKVKFIDDLKKYNNEQGLALDDFEPLAAPVSFDSPNWFQPPIFSGVPYLKRTFSPSIH